MKLYLSSYRIPVPQALYDLVGKHSVDIRTALIPNAKDYYSLRAQSYKIDQIRDYQRSIGMKAADLVDLRDHRDQDVLRRQLLKYDLIWAVGGNTFCLRQEMRRSGFDEILPHLLSKGVVYGGDSAGALVVGRSLRGIESVDIPAFTEEAIYDGVGIINKVLLPHADNDYFAEANQRTRELFESDDLIELTDAQALVIDGDERILVTADVVTNQS